jgi:hypothetical protein
VGFRHVQLRDVISVKQLVSTQYSKGIETKMVLKAWVCTAQGAVRNLLHSKFSKDWISIYQSTMVSPHDITNYIKAKMTYSIRLG